MGNSGRILMVAGVLLACYAGFRVVGLVASMMIRAFFPAAILVIAVVAFYAGYRMKRKD
jgi:hypothetical protein